MSEPAPLPLPPSVQTDVPVHCAACGKFNERTAINCSACGAHLWIKCSKCGTKTVRTASRCSRCRKLLRVVSVSLPRWNWRRLFRHRRRKRIIRAVALTILVVLASWGVYHFLPEPDHAPSYSTPFQ